MLIKNSSCKSLVFCRILEFHIVNHVIEIDTGWNILQKN